ncbi:MAG: Hsp20/alpha crystallin family protein [Sedimentisphaerales bacterium]|nr:Hsp20/alpha crystallin family protein [Sedimentisphaerales bacterium]
MERAITRRGESTPLASLQEEMNDLFGHFFGGSSLVWPERTYWPAINIADKEDAVVVTAEVPGCKPEDIEISVHGNTMSISGEKKEKTEEKKKNYYHMESRYGSFRRELILPAEVNADKIEAKCQEGVLTITLPKAEKAKAKKIKVKAE